MATLKNMHKITVTMMPHREWRDLYLIASRSCAAPGALGRLARAEAPAAHEAIAAAADATDLETRPAAGACEDLVAQGLDHRFCATGPLCGIHLALSVRTRRSCAIFALSALRRLFMISQPGDFDVSALHHEVAATSSLRTSPCAIARLGWVAHAQLIEFSSWLHRVSFWSTRHHETPSKAGFNHGQGPGRFADR
jgi:hypothetical protein